MHPKLIQARKKLQKLAGRGDIYDMPDVGEEEDTGSNLEVGEGYITGRLLKKRIGRQAGQGLHYEGPPIGGPTNAQIMMSGDSPSLITPMRDRDLPDKIKYIKHSQLQYATLFNRGLERVSARNH